MKRSAAAESVCRLAASLADPAPTPPPAQADWTHIDTIAARAGLGPAVYVAVERAAPHLAIRLPESRAAAFVARGKTGHLLGRAAALGAALSDAGIPAIALKGIVLAKTHYPAHGARLMTDLDLLIRQPQLDLAEKLLLRLGYEIACDARFARRLRWSHHHLPPYRHPRFGDIVELHHNLAPPANALRVQPDRLWDDAAPLAALPGLLAPHPRDLFVHSLLHLLHSSPVAGRLRDLLDLHLIAATMRDAAVWDGLRSRAAEFGVTRYLTIGVHLLAAVFKTPIPPAAADAIRRDPQAPQPRELQRFLDAAGADLVDAPNARLIHWFAMRKVWMERPGVGTALRLAGSAVAGTLRPR